MKKESEVIRSRASIAIWVLGSLLLLSGIVHVASFISMWMFGRAGQTYLASLTTPHGTELFVTYVFEKSAQFGQGWTIVAIATVIIVALLISGAAVFVAIWMIYKLACMVGRGTKKAASGTMSAATNSLNRVASKKKVHSDSSIPTSDNLADQPWASS